MTAHPEAFRFEADEAARRRDRERLDELLAAPPAQVLVASDLHLGRGRLRDGDRITGKENFFGDLAFRRLLRYWSRSPDSDPGLLILLGDIFDYVRHDEPPEHDSLDSDDLIFWRDRLDEIGIRVKVTDLQQSINRTERLYGLKSDPIKSVYKFADIARGHPEFFEGLAEWVGRGGRVLVVRGNHDLEWWWLAVRAAFRAAIGRAEAGRALPPELLERRVLFADEVGVSLGNVYLEHGHEFEDTTAVAPNGPVLARVPLELSWPLGSFINRYLINPMEDIDPFLDNIKPVQDALLAVIKKYPLKSVGIGIRGWRFLLRALQMRRFAGGLAVLLWMGLAVLPVLTVVVATVALLFPEFGGWLLDRLGRGAAPAGLAGVAGPYIVGAVREFIADIAPPKTIDQKAFAAREAILEALPGPRTYLVLGHTHDLDSHLILRQDERTLQFINTGSWTPTWTAHQRDLRAGTLHPVVAFTMEQTGYVHTCFEWDDARNAPVPAVILDRR